MRRWLLVLLCLLPFVARAQETITLASTTSTEQSGLFAHLLPAFTRATGIGVHVVAVGTGQALELGRRGDADVLLVHDTPSELAFIAAGWGVDRRDVMYNDFVLIGPAADPAHVAGQTDITAALQKIAATASPFISRGDDSGTHIAERRLWAEAGLLPAGSWYRDIGGGMGAALNMAAATGAYTLSDRATWLSFQNRRGLVIAVQGDGRLLNQYGVMLVSPARHPAVKAAAGQAFIDWLTGPAGQRTIDGYMIDNQQLFFANAHP